MTEPYKALGISDAVLTFGEKVLAGLAERFSQIDAVYIDLHILDGNLGARGKVVADSRTVNFHTSGISIRGWIKYASSNIHHDIAHGSRPTIKGTARTPDINAAMVGLNILLHRLKSAARDIDGRSTRH